MAIAPATQQYLDLLAAPPIKSLADFQAAALAFQGAVPLYSAELQVELAPLQNAVIDETTPALVAPLNNAYQRTQFLQNRLERLAALMQEIRVGLIDLGNDQTAVKAAANG